MNITFTFEYINHVTEWHDKPLSYTDVLYIFMDKISGNTIASCIIYWYDEYPWEIQIRNLYVTPQYRKKCIARTIIRDLQKFCMMNSKILRLWAKNNTWLIKWYESLGFEAIRKNKRMKDIHFRFNHYVKYKE